MLVRKIIEPVRSKITAAMLLFPCSRQDNSAGLRFLNVLAFSKIETSLKFFYGAP